MLNTIFLVIIKTFNRLLVNQNLIVSDQQQCHGGQNKTLKSEIIVYRVMIVMTLTT